MRMVAGAIFVLAAAVLAVLFLRDRPSDLGLRAYGELGPAATALDDEHAPGRCPDLGRELGVDLRPGPRLPSRVSLLTALRRPKKISVRARAPLVAVPTSASICAASKRSSFCSRGTRSNFNSWAKLTRSADKPRPMLAK